MLSWFLVIIRIIAYLTVIYAMLGIVYMKKEPSSNDGLTDHVCSPSRRNSFLVFVWRRENTAS